VETDQSPLHPSAFFIPNLAPLMAAGGDKVLGTPSTLSPPAAISGARFGIKKADGICRSPSNCQNTFHFENCGKDGRFRSWAGLEKNDTSL